MAYSAPSAGAVDFSLESGYTPPGGDGVNFAYSPPPDLGVNSGMNVTVGMAYGEAPKRYRRTRSPFGPYRTPDARVVLRLRPLPHLGTRAHLPWGAFRELQKRDAIPWGDTAARPTRARAPGWQALDPRDERTGNGWDSSIKPREDGSTMSWIVPPWIDRIWRHDHDHVDPYRIKGVQPPTYEPPGRGDTIDFDLTSDHTPPTWDAVDFNLRDPLPNHRIGPRDGARSSQWDPQLPWRDANDELPWGPRGSRDTPGIDLSYPQEPPEPPPDPPPLPPEKRVYLLMPSIEAKRVSDNTPVMVNAATISTDRDSWAWEVDLTLARREDRDAIKPTASGPREIEVTINGRAWRCLIERHQRQKKHASSSYSARGRSLAAELTTPYSAPRTYTATSDRTAQQLAVDELENTGWSLVWNTTDWLVPANTFSYQGLTPLQAIIRVAEAVGAVVSTDRTSRTLYVNPRYGVSPWERNEVVADAAITEDIITQLSGEWEAGPGYNAVYIAGRQQGVIVHVVRDGTPQDTEAEMVVDDLIVERLAGRERGRQVLAEGGDRERVPMVMTLLPEPEPPGLLLPGTLLEVNEEGETWRGQVMSTQISGKRSNATTVRQQIEVDRYHA